MKKEILKKSLVFSFLFLLKLSCSSQNYIVNTINGIEQLNYLKFDSCLYSGDNYILILEFSNCILNGTKIISKKKHFEKNELKCQNLVLKRIPRKKLSSIDVMFNQTIEVFLKNSCHGSYCYILIKSNNKHMVFAFPNSNLKNAKSVLKKINIDVYNQLKQI